MENFIVGNCMFAKRILLHILFIVLALLPIINVEGQISQKEKDDPVLARGMAELRQLAKAAGNRSISPDSALSIFRRAVALAKKHKLRTTTANMWHGMAERKYQQGDLAGSHRYLDSAFALNEELKNAELTCMLNSFAAQLHEQASNYAKAAACYFRAVQVVEEHKISDEFLITTLYNNLGIFLMNLDEDSLARKYLIRAREHVLKMQPVDSAMLINIYVMLGSTLLKTDSVAARGYFKNAYAMAEEYNDMYLSHMTLENLAMCYVVIEQYDTAEHFLELAKATTPPGESLEGMEEIEGELAFGRKDYTKAEKHLLNALKLNGSDTDGLVGGIYETLSDLYEARGEYQKAYTYHKKFMEQYKKVRGDAKKIVADFMLSFQTLEHEKMILQKQAEIASRENAIKKQRFWIAAMCLVSVLLCTVLMMAYRNYRNKKRLLSQQMRALLQDQEIERLKAEAEGADNERARIAYDIHDGVLVRLANVKMNLAGLPSMLPEFAGGERYENVVGQLDMATRELRNTAHNLMPEILLEEGMAQAIFYFCKATEQSSGLSIKFQQVGGTFPRLQPQVETAIYRIVQGLIQNVIQHAEATTTLVQLQYADHLCSITVEDNGKGMTGIENEEGHGIKSIRNRIKILKGTFDIESQAGHGTTVYFEFDARPFLQDTTVNR